MPDYDDPAVEEEWCENRRDDVKEYLHRQGVQHGRVGDWPAWHVAPYIAVWAVESLKQPDSVGWWVICGDLPTDYVSAAGIDHPRQVLTSIAGEWREQARLMLSGQRPDAIRIGRPDEWADLGPLLEARASLLLKFAEDDSIWADV